MVEVNAAEPWRVSIPVRVAPKPIPPKSVVSGYKLDANTPAYKNRRGMMLINEVKGKKVIIKMDGSQVVGEEVVDTTPKQQALLDF